MKSYVKFYRVFFILLFVFNFILAQHSVPDTLRAFYYDGNIKLDGVLSEECWSKAIPISNFTQREQEEGAAPTERTEISVVYNTNELYFGIKCFDSEPEKISAHKMERDFSWRSDDNLEIMLSTFNDDRNGYLFVINPNGAMADVWVGDEGKDWNKDWNGVWDASVKVTSEGWFAEIVIPFSTLKFRNQIEQTWGINFERNIRRKKEQLMWQGWSRLYDVEKISQGGKLVGIRNIKRGTKVELKPYVLGGVENESSNFSNSGKLGGELNIDITPTLKLNFSANTDFAQVESDRKQINLSRFDLYYPEKRQFFLEGKNYYDMRMGRLHLFYSRRIGIEDETEVPLVGGMRLFGKVNGTGIGVMSIQTEGVDSIPSANFSVVKLQQDIFKQSTFGIIATQKYDKDHYNRVYGGEFRYSTSSFMGQHNLIVGGSMAISDTKIFEEEENLNKDNWAYRFFLSYPNDVIEYDLGFTAIQQGFNPEMGYTSRSNYQMLYTELQFNPRFKKLPFFRNLIFKPLDVNYYINDETKEMETVFYEWRPFGFVSKSGEFMEFNIQHIYDKPEEAFELIDSVYIPAGSYWDTRYELQFRTYRGRKLSADLFWQTGEFYTGTRQVYEMGMEYNFNHHLNMGIDWERNYIELPEGSLATDELGGRIDYAFNPKLVTTVFTQWNNEDDYILVNYRLNWIPKPGSFFYFVINQELSTDKKIKMERLTVIGKLIWRFAL